MAASCLSLASVGARAARARFAACLSSAGFSSSSLAEEAFGPNRAAEKLADIVESQFTQMREAGTFKHERVIVGPQETSVTVSDRSEPVINMCANNYLGLSNDPTVVRAAQKALETHGFGVSSVRFICGTQDIHKSLESKLTAFHGTEDTILYPSCFDANAGLFEVLLTAEDAILSDELNHASIIDGVRLCKARRLRYKHMDLGDLEQNLRDSQDARLRLIATDGVFSMDGHVAPLREIVALAREYEALVFVDDCHGTGFLGARGRGTDEHCGLPPGSIDIINSTLGKALGGGTGGYTTGSSEVVGLLRQRARPYLFSNSLAPSAAAAGAAVMDMIHHDTSLRDRLERNAKRFRAEMRRAGFDLNEGDHPIVPIMLGDAKLAHDMAEMLLAKRVYAIGFSYPVVPKGKARIRVQISAAHTDEELSTAIAAFVDVGRELGVIENDWKSIS